MFEFLLSYETLDQIPDEFQPLYEEKGGKYQMVAPLARKVHDLGKLNTSLEAERKNAKTNKELAEAYAAAANGLKPDELATAFEEMQALKDKVDSGEVKPEDAEKLEEIINARIERVQKGHERELERIRAEAGKKDEAVKRLDGMLRSTRLDQELRAAAAEAGIERHSIDDAILNARQVFEPDEEYNPRPREGSGYGADYRPASYFKEIKDSGEKPGWFYKPSNQGSDVVPGGRTGAGGKKIVTRADLAKLNPVDRQKMALSVSEGKIELVD